MLLAPVVGAGWAIVPSKSPLTSTFGPNADALVATSATTLKMTTRKHDKPVAGRRRPFVLIFGTTPMATCNFDDLFIMIPSAKAITRAALIWAGARLGYQVVCRAVWAHFHMDCRQAE